jgi:outer membrane protease
MEQMYYQSPTGELWTEEQWNEYVKYEGDRQIKDSEDDCHDCYGCEKCETMP